MTGGVNTRCVRDARLFVDDEEPGSINAIHFEELEFCSGALFWTTRGEVLPDPFDIYCCENTGDII